MFKRTTATWIIQSLVREKKKKIGTYFIVSGIAPVLLGFQKCNGRSSAINTKSERLGYAKQLKIFNLGLAAM